MARTSDWMVYPLKSVPPKNGRQRLANANGFSASLTSTLLPSRSRTANFPVAFTQNAGGVSPPLSKSNVQGNGGITRMRDEAESDPAMAFTIPACAPVDASGVKRPFSTVPFNPSSVHVAWAGAATGRPLASKALIVSGTASPGLRIRSVGVTRSAATSPAADAGGGAGDEFAGGAAAAEPVVPFGQSAYIAAIVTT